MLRTLLVGGLVCLSWFSTARTAHAQVIWGGEAERYFRPGTFLPFDGQSIQMQYGYDTASPFLLFGNAANANQLRYLDYADRLERAYKFGYPVPLPPTQCAPSTTLFPRLGLGAGFFWQR
jgi:hypothetical protein